MASPILIDASVILYFKDKIINPEDAFKDFHPSAMKREIRQIPEDERFNSTAVLIFTSPQEETQISISRNQMDIAINASGRITFDASRQQNLSVQTQNVFDHIKEKVSIKRIGLVVNYVLELHEPEIVLKKIFDLNFTKAFSNSILTNDAGIKYMVIEKYDSMNDLKVHNGVQLSAVEAEIEGEEEKRTAISILRDFNSLNEDDNSKIFNENTTIDKFLKTSFSKLNIDSLVRYLGHGN